MRIERGREDDKRLEYTCDCGYGCPYVFLIWPPSCIKSVSFFAPAQLLSGGQLIKGCAAIMTIAFLIHHYNGADFGA